VYVDAARWQAGTPTGRHRLQSIAQALNRSVVLAGSSAARVHGFAVLQLPREVCVLRAGEVPRHHVIEAYDVEVTTPARSVVDCARRDGFEAGVVVADSALHANATTLAELAAIIGEGRRWSGIDTAVAVVAEANARAESALESLSRVRLVQQGLPRPEPQVTIDVGPMENYRVDFYWPAYRVIGEADGLTKYDNPRVLHAEKLREMALHDAGFEVVRWTWHEMWLQPDIVADRVRRAFARAAARAIR
jgi:very-short-patch-repair endonuclease